MSSPPVTPVQSDTILPERVEVVIVGGGIVGACTALFLARKGVRVAVCEKGYIGGEQSSRNWGWCRKMGRDYREMPLIIESMRLWEGMDAMSEGQTGFRHGGGTTYFTDDAAQMERYIGWLDNVSQYQIDTKVLSGSELARMFPGSARPWVGGLHTASDGMAEPGLATSAIVEGARKLGAAIFTNTAVRGVETKAGRVCTVVTEKGRIDCDSVVVAGGGWSSLFLRNLGIRLPQLKVLANVMRTAPIEDGPQGCGSGPGFGFRKRLDGGYNVSMRSAHPVDIVPDSFRFLGDFRQALSSERKAMRFRIGKRSFQEALMPSRWSLDSKTSFEKYRTLDPTPADDILDQAGRNIGAIFPAMAKMKVLEKTAGFVDVTPDAIPVISPVETMPGLYVSTGYSGHGFGIAPGAGRLMAQMITGDQPLVDPAPYRFSRFSDGSKIVHWPMGF
ncbi:NAD(P)/FAD-dependent oxidoreductase [Humitalea sp. 24SJ18S-53]|uniref:NAD(P)/FAD-dependent oxidoreductase n=1 Tax=Humitalea sp. 24SJ18S-53 TaxID=3422307 RepID=UPI003D67736D